MCVGGGMLKNPTSTFDTIESLVPYLMKHRGNSVLVWKLPLINDMNWQLAYRGEVFKFLLSLPSCGCYGMYISALSGISRDSCRGRSPFYFSTFVDVLMDSRGPRGGMEAPHCRACSIIVRANAPFLRWMEARSDVQVQPGKKGSRP